MNAVVRLIGYAAWLVKNIDENLVCEFHMITKNNYLHMKQPRAILKTLTPFFILLLITSNLFANSVDITKFGAKGDGVKLNTDAIQKAIDECANIGGGEVIVPQGTYVTGTLTLKDNVTLYLQTGAIIKGSIDIRDYPLHKALIYGGGAKNVAIRGYGAINGDGKAFPQKDDSPGRPKLVVFDNCVNVLIQDVFLCNSAMWTLHLQKCDGVRINNINIFSHDNYNNDGIDIESKNVIISDCNIDTDDDAIVFKSGDPEYIVENATVTNCILSTNCNFIKFGTGSKGVFRNVSISNCSLKKSSVSSKFHPWPRIVWGVTAPTTGISGIALEVVDGGSMDQVAISNITMTDVQTPIFIRLGKRNTDERVGSLKNVIISGVVATSQSFISSSITGVQGQNVENVTIRDCLFNVKGGGTASDAAKEVFEVPHFYPENRMFDQMLPSYGFYIRHGKNIVLDNVQLRYHTGKEERHAIVAEDVSLLQIRNSMWEKPVGSLESLRIKDCPDIILRDNIETK